MSVNFTPATEVLGGWRVAHLSGRPPTLYPVAGDGPLAQVEVGPGLVSVVGGPPGSGKTALVMQWVLEALRLSPGLRALVANVEMPPAAMLDRQLARLSGVDLHAVRHRRAAAAHPDRVAHGLAALAAVADRLAFGGAPFDVANVARSADAFAADLVVLDYVQRFAAAGQAGAADRRGAVDAVMAAVRGMADCGAAVIVVAAVGRQRDEKGRSGYSGLSLASFRESSELEYGADDAFILCRDDPNDPAAALLKHVKSRHGERRDIPLRFHGAVQRFDPDTDRPDPAGLAADIRGAWGLADADAAGEGGGW